jgi:hypothetical protein
MLSTDKTLSERIAVTKNGPEEGNTEPSVTTSDAAGAVRAVATVVPELFLVW